MGKNLKRSGATPKKRTSSLTPIPRTKYPRCRVCSYFHRKLASRTEMVGIIPLAIQSRNVSLPRANGSGSPCSILRNIVLAGDLTYAPVIMYSRSRSAADLSALTAARLPLGQVRLLP